MINEIYNKLLEIDNTVYYGMVDNVNNNDEWNYTVFFRTVGNYKKNLNSNIYFKVAIVRENYIQDTLLNTIIEKVEELDGVRVVESSINFEYTMKNNTNTVCEILTLDFVKSFKISR